MGKFLDKAGVTHLWQKIKSTLTGYMRTDGGNSLTLSGGSGNTSGWRLVLETSIGGWTICNIVMAVASRHQGQGVLSVAFHSSNDSGTAWISDIRLSASVASVATSGDNRPWRAFYNASTKKFRLYWRFYDYSPATVNVLSRSGFDAPKNGTWYTSLPSDNGTELSITINRADTAGALNSQGKRTALSGTTAAPAGLRMYEVYNNGYPTSYGNLISVCGATSYGNGELLLGWSGTSGAVAHLYYRNKRDQGDASWSAWSTVAFTTDNVASATKLQTARKLWGQSFDGSADVSGDLALANKRITWTGHGSNYVGDGANDISPTVGGALANLVISAWYGLSFTTECEGTYKGKTSVGIDTRSGTLRAAKVEAASAKINSIVNEDYVHRLEIGRPNVNQWDFYEHGGVFNFYKCQDKTGASKTLILKIDNGNVTLPGTLTAATLSGALAWGKLTGVPAIVTSLVTWGKFVTEVRLYPSVNQVFFGSTDGTSGVQTTITFNKVNGKSILASGSASGNIDTTPPVATQSANGLMSAADKKSFDAIKGKSVLASLSDIYTEQSADYVGICLDTTTLSLGGGETTHQKGVIGSIDMATQTVAGVMSAADKKKLDGLGVKELPAGTDLDTVTTPGMYHWDYSKIGSMPANTPPSLAAATDFTLLVMRTSNSALTQLLFYTAYYPLKMYARNFTVTPSTDKATSPRSWYVLDFHDLMTKDE